MRENLNSRSPTTRMVCASISLLFHQLTSNLQAQLWKSVLRQLLSNNGCGEAGEES